MQAVQLRISKAQEVAFPWKTSFFFFSGCDLQSLASCNVVYLILGASLPFSRRPTEKPSGAGW